MGKGRRYDQEYKDMIVELFKSGMSLAELSSEYGIAKSTINGWIKDVKEINGLKVAFIDYTYGTNGIPVPEGKKYCVNLIDKDLIKKHIKMAKDENADIIIASMHWGTEYRTTANEEQKELSNFLFQWCEYNYR